MEQYKTDESTIDCMLQEAYGRETVPESVNIRLQNRLKCKEVMKETSISVWWLPASLSTVLAVAGFVIAFILYLIVNLYGNYIMPNFVQMISGNFIKLQLIGMTAQIVVSWMMTFIGLWKLNFYQNAHIF